MKQFLTRLKKNRKLHLISLVLVGLVLLAGYPILIHVRAAVVLLKVAGNPPKNTPVLFGNYTVDETLFTFIHASKTIRARLFVPRGVAKPTGMVVVHGVHRLGLDEPRLMTFSRALAATGIMILTPEVAELADYSIQVEAMETIGGAAKHLSEKLQRQPVGLMGLSFAGGLALLTAADPQYQSTIKFVFAVGAHHDLVRVSRFFATNTMIFPDGHSETMPAHPYGPLVVVYSHLPVFFPESDLPLARETLRLWLWEQHDQARQKARELPAPSQTKMQILLDQKIDQIAPEILHQIDRHQTEMKTVSPDDHLATLKIPVFLLHGAGDSVIPPSESVWLEQELPTTIERHMLITPLIGHVELSKNPSWNDKWNLVHLLAKVIDAAD